MYYKYPHDSKTDVLTAINLLILFCRKNESSTNHQLDDLESTLIELEEKLKK